MSTTFRILLNFKFIGQTSRSHGHRATLRRAGSSITAV